MNTEHFYTKSGIVCPRLGVGCVAYGNSIDKLGKNIPEDQAVKIMLNLYKRGLRVFDTADTYGFRKEHAGNPEKDGWGESERRLAHVIREVGRENLFIATKGGKYRGDIDGDARFQYHQPPKTRIFDPAYIKECVAQSCERLGTDYIDLFQLHGPLMDTPERVEHVTELLENLMNNPKIRLVGVSVNDVSEAIELLHRGSTIPFPNAIQVIYNIFEHNKVQPLFELIEKQQHPVFVIAREPLARGFLAGQNGKYCAADWQHQRAFPPGVQKYLRKVATGLGHNSKNEDDVLKAYLYLLNRVNEIVSIVREEIGDDDDDIKKPRYTESLTQLALKFAMTPPHVAAVIPSISKEKYIDDCFGVLSAIATDEFEQGFYLHDLEELEDIATSVEY